MGVFFFLQGLFRRQDLWRRFKRHVAVTFSPFWGMWLLTFWLNVSQMNLGWEALPPWQQKKSGVRQSGNHFTDAFADHFLYSQIHSLVYEAQIVKNAAMISRSILWLSEINQPPAILIIESVWVIFKDLGFLNVNMFWLHCSSITVNWISVTSSWASGNTDSHFSPFSHILQTKQRIN